MEEDGLNMRLGRARRRGARAGSRRAGRGGVAEQLMCPVCQGRTVADYTSDLAAQMRRLIWERLQAGERPQQIIAYFVER